MSHTILIPLPLERERATETWNPFMRELGESTKKLFLSGEMGGIGFSIRSEALASQLH